MIIDDYINQEKWDELIIYVKELDRNKMQRHSKYELYNLAYCLWYILDEWGRFAPEIEDILDEVNTNLLEIHRLIKSNYYDESEYCFFAGYMISMFPEFYEEEFGDYRVAYNHGKALLEKAEELEFCLAAVLGGKGSKEEAREYVDDKFEEEWLIVGYLKWVLFEEVD